MASAPIITSRGSRWIDSSYLFVSLCPFFSSSDTLLFFFSVLLLWLIRFGGGHDWCSTLGKLLARRTDETTGYNT